MARAGDNKNTNARLAANKRYDSKTYKVINLNFRKNDDAELMAALYDAKEHGSSYRETLWDWYSAYRNAETAAETEEPDYLGVQNMVLQLGGQEKLESMQESGELDRLRDMILSDSRVQLIAEEYVSNAVK